MKVSGQGVLVRPDVVMKDVVDVVSGHGLWYVDFNSVIHDDVSVRTVSQIELPVIRKSGLPVQGVT